MNYADDMWLYLVLQDKFKNTILEHLSTSIYGQIVNNPKIDNKYIIFNIDKFYEALSKAYYMYDKDKNIVEEALKIINELS